MDEVVLVWCADVPNILPFSSFHFLLHVTICQIYYFKLKVISFLFCKEVVHVCLLIIESTPFKLNFHVTDEDLFPSSSFKRQKMCGKTIRCEMWERGMVNRKMLFAWGCVIALRAASDDDASLLWRYDDKNQGRGILHILKLCCVTP